MKLISMTDFCLEILNEDPPYNEVGMLTKISNYANFLKLPLTLGMFVPVDEEGDIMKEPNPLMYELAASGNKTHALDVEQWNTAKEKVLFSGVKIIHKENFFLIEDVNGYWLRVVKKKTLTTVEDLLKLSGVELTPSALKKIGI